MDTRGSSRILTKPLCMHYSDYSVHQFLSKNLPTSGRCLAIHPPGPGHVDCQWSENGSKPHNKHFENRGWKLTPAFCHLSMTFLALDPRFQWHTYGDDWDLGGSSTPDFYFYSYCQSLEVMLSEIISVMIFIDFKMHYFIRKFTEQTTTLVICWLWWKLCWGRIASPRLKSSPWGISSGKQAWTDAAVDTTTIRHPTS